MVARIGNIDCHGLTDVGRSRRVNEDQFLIADLRKSMTFAQTSVPHAEHVRLSGASHGQLLVVADGLGGMGHGDRASRIAVDTVAAFVVDRMPWFEELDRRREDALTEALVEALRKSKSAIQDETAAHPENHGMGTTLTAACILGDRMLVVHAGDSRCYIGRGSKLRQVTRDHTVAQQLVEQGMIKPEAARGSPWSNMVWNVVGGTSPALEPETHREDLREGDTILLCTDGLTVHLTDERIRKVLDRERSPAGACRKLIDEAMAAGGSDNITVIVARVQGQ